MKPDRHPSSMSSPPQSSLSSPRVDRMASLTTHLTSLASKPLTSAVAFSLLTCLLLLWTKCHTRGPKLPPGPLGWPIVGNLFQIILAGKSFIHYVHDLQRQYGPIFTLKMGYRTVIVVSSAELAHEALVRKAQTFASRPVESPTRNIFSCGKFTVNSAVYGPEWRSLRRNMASGMLSATRLVEFRPVREAAMERFVNHLSKEAEENGGAVWVLKNARFAVFCILLAMCFGLDLDEDTVVQVEEMMKKVVMVVHPRIDDYIPFLGPLFRRQQKEALVVRQQQLNTIIPLIHRRRSILRQKLQNTTSSYSYLDSLLDLKVEGRSSTPSDPELVTLCTEFLTGGTDTTAAAVEWAVARIIDNPQTQSRIHDEILSATGGNRNVDEKDVERMPYLQAFVKEVLRRHPPVHFTLSHAATEPTTLGGYDVPTDAYLDFHLEGISADEKVWKDAAAFQPERFLNGAEEAELTGASAVKMIPFGAGRRVCPGMGMAMTHIPLMVARMVQEFEWALHPSLPPLDFSYKYEFTVVMTPTLRAVIKLRK